MITLILFQEAREDTRNPTTIKDILGSLLPTTLGITLAILCGLALNHHHQTQQAHQAKTKNSITQAYGNITLLTQTSNGNWNELNHTQLTNTHTQEVAFYDENGNLWDNAYLQLVEEHNNPDTSLSRTYRLMVDEPTGLQEYNPDEHQNN